MGKIEFLVDEVDKRADQFISERVDEISRSRAAQMIRNGNVKVDGLNVKPSFRLKVDQEIVITPSPVEESKIIPQDIPVEIVFEDNDVIVVDKPSGMPVHVGPGHPDGTLVNALLSLCPDLKSIGNIIRPGIIHRLDLDTSGIMVVAKTGRACLMTFGPAGYIRPHSREICCMVVSLWGAKSRVGFRDDRERPIHRGLSAQET